MQSSWYRSITILAVAICALFLLSAPPAQAEKDQVDHPTCPYCGMDRTKFAHSRALINYDDGTSVGTCSLHCAAIDLALKIDKTPTNIMVADYNTQKLIDAETAHWVIGGDKMGVMTRRAKWAFAADADAQAFIDAHGGNAAEFSEAVKAAFDDMYEDLQMIRKKREKMRSKSGS